MKTITALGLAMPLWCIACSRAPHVEYMAGASMASCTKLSGDLATVAQTISGGTPYDHSQTAFAAFDQNAATYATLASSPSTFIGQDFGTSPQQLQHVRLTGTVSYGFDAKLQYSDDASTWTDAGLAIDVPPSSTAPVDADVPDVGGAHRYWRFLDLGEYGYMQIASAELFACAGSSMCSSFSGDLENPSATISTGSPYDGGQAAANAFDQNNATYATLATSATTFIGQDFQGAAQEIRRVILTGTVSYGFNAKLQYSDDATSWTDTGVTVNVPPFSSDPVQVDIEAFGTHRYWGFLDQGGYDYLQIASVQMLGCAAVVTACTAYTSNLETAAATISAGTPYDEAQDAPNAFDQNLSTYATLATSAATFIGQNFGSNPQEIRRVVLTGTVDYGFSGNLQYSDDGAAWTDAGLSVTVPPLSSSAFEFDVPAAGTHQYWRFLDRGAFDYMEIASVEMFACAPETPPCTYPTDLTSAAATICGGTPYDDSQGAENAFDHDSATYSTIATSASTYVGQDFGSSPQEIRRVTLTGTVSYGFDASLQYSDDGTTWTDSGATVNVPPFDSNPIQVDVNPVGAHQYWRFFDLGGYDYLQIASADMRACN